MGIYGELGRHRITEQAGGAGTASLVRKTIRGHQYWYAVESKRVNGKPRIVWQKYLGKVEDILRRLEGGEADSEPFVYEFGAVAALLAIAERLGLEATLNRCCPKRDQGLPVGRYLLLAAINRVVAPTSKVKIGAWYEETVLHRLWGVAGKEFSSQRFWEAMDRVDESAIHAAEDALADTLTRQFGVAVRALVYDATNFFSYIGTDNPAAIPQRGHNKQKRGDLKQINLALLVSTDGHIPLLHEVYPGNVPDSKQFAAILARLADRCAVLAAGGEQEITVVYDKGNNSAPNLAAVDAAPFHFVSSVVPIHHADLLEVPRAAYHQVSPDRWPGLLAYRTLKSIYGAQRAVVVTFNPRLREGQLKGLHAQQAKIEAALAKLQAKLATWATMPQPHGRRPTPQSVGRTIARLLRGRQLGPLLHWQAQDREAVVELTYHWDQDAFDAMDERSLGKTVLFSDHLDWSDEAIVAAYRGQSRIEDAFKQMKDPHLVCWWPLFHWTDQKIRVHAFYCVLALLLASLLHREARRAGIPGDFDALLHTLAGIRGVLDLPKAGTGKRAGLKVRLTRQSPEQQRLFDLLQLQRYQPQARMA